MNESEYQFSLTRAALSTSGRAKHQIGSYQLRCPVLRHPRRAPPGRRSLLGTRGSGGVLSYRFRLMSGGTVSCNCRLVAGWLRLLVAVALTSPQVVHTLDDS